MPVNMLFALSQEMARECPWLSAQTLAKLWVGRTVVMLARVQSGSPHRNPARLNPLLPLESWAMRISAKTLPVWSSAPVLDPSLKKVPWRTARVSDAVALAPQASVTARLTDTVTTRIVRSVGLFRLRRVRPAPVLVFDAGLPKGREDQRSGPVLMPRATSVLETPFSEVSSPCQLLKLMHGGEPGGLHATPLNPSKNAWLRAGTRISPSAATITITPLSPFMDASSWTPRAPFWI